LGRFPGSIGAVQTLAAVLGQTIRRHRLAAGLSQEKLAERAEVHRNEVGFLERGERSPSVAVLVRVGEALGVPAWILLREAQEGDKDSAGRR
jgi:transcriptional regulator with XRE-family HTH domain